MGAIYSHGGNRWNILGFNFTKRDALSSVYKISMILAKYTRICKWNAKFCSVNYENVFRPNQEQLRLKGR